MRFACVAVGFLGFGFCFRVPVGGLDLILFAGLGRVFWDFGFCLQEVWVGAIWVVD